MHWVAEPPRLVPRLLLSAQPSFTGMLMRNPNRLPSKTYFTLLDSIRNKGFATPATASRIEEAAHDTIDVKVRCVMLGLQHMSFLGSSIARCLRSRRSCWQRRRRNSLRRRGKDRWLLLRSLLVICCSFVPSRNWHKASFILAWTFRFPNSQTTTMMSIASDRVCVFRTNNVAQSSGQTMRMCRTSSMRGVLIRALTWTYTSHKYYSN